MKIKFCCLFIIGLLTIPAIATVKDSADFPNKYEGDMLPDAAGFTYSGTLPYAAYNSTDGSIISLDTNSTTGGQSSYWYKTAGATTTNGYTVEIKLKVISSPDTGTDVNRGFWLSTKLSNGSGAILSFFNNSVMHRGGGDGMIIFGDNTDAFHTYRIVIAPGGSTFDVYRDNVLVIDDRAVGAVWEEIGFGDPTGNGPTPDTNVEIDYIRWDATGAYTPVFPNRYDGDKLPSEVGWTYSGSLPITAYNSSNGEVLTFDTETAAGGQTGAWSRGWTLDAQTGHTVEARLKIVSSPDTGTDVNRGFWFMVDTGVTLSFLNSSIMHRGGGDEMIVTADNTNDFHVYRACISPGGATFDLYRDDVLVVDNRPVGALGDASSIYFGDPTGNGTTPDLNVQIDYIWWDTTGAYPPNTTPGGCPGPYLSADLNHDCYIDYEDIEVLTVEWLNCTDPANVICE